MPIDIKKVQAAKPIVTEQHYSQNDVILYHLGVGAGYPPADPHDPRELKYLYEKNLKVLPSYGVIPVFPLMFETVTKTPGIDINLANVLHGEQEIEIHRPLPATAELESSARVADIYDKGKAALIIVEVQTKEKGGEPICTNRFSIFARGEGGFGGEKGPKAGNQAPDERAPDFMVESPSAVRQPLLYRLTGDMNPLHADPEVAKKAGFPKPILQGLCTFGIACKAVVDNVLDGDVTKVAGYGVRFAGIFFPGDTLVTKVWKDDGKLLVSSHSKEGGGFVLTNAFIKLK
jgi:acyl dehydratase